MSKTYVALSGENRSDKADCRSKAVAFQLRLLISGVTLGPRIKARAQTVGKTMNVTPVRWGILGAAKFALDHMGPAIHMAKGAELAAIATSAAEKAEPFQAFAPGLRVYLNYDDLLADPEIDAVYVPLPNHLHVEWTLKALAAGKHVLCEKPVALTAPEVNALVAKRDETGLLAAEAYMIVHHPQFLRAKELVSQGAIGRLMHVDTHFSFNNSAETQNIRNRPETGGGALYDIGVYTIGAARFVTGEEPKAIRHAMVQRENDVDVTAQFAAEFDSFSYSGLVSMRMHTRQDITFTGDTGMLRLTCPYNANVHDISELVLEQGGQGRSVERWPRVNQYVHQVENFGRSVRDGTSYPCPLEFSQGTLAMIDAVRAAG